MSSEMERMDEGKDGGREGISLSLSCILAHLNPPSYGINVLKR